MLFRSPISTPRYIHGTDQTGARLAILAIPIELSLQKPRIAKIASLTPRFTPSGETLNPRSFVDNCSVVTSVVTEGNAARVWPARGMTSAAVAIKESEPASGEYFRNDVVLDAHLPSSNQQIGGEQGGGAPITMLRLFWFSPRLDRVAR